MIGHQLHWFIDKYFSKPTTIIFLFFNLLSQATTATTVLFIFPLNVLVLKGRGKLPHKTCILKHPCNL